MLYLYLDDARQRLPEEYESRPQDYFDMEFEPEWFADPFVRELIKSIDESEVVGVGKGVNIYNEVLGNIPPQYLSTGCKSLILLWLTDLKVDGDRLGDNCFPYLFKIAEKKDITISISHTPLGYQGDFPAYILNNGHIIKTKDEFLGELIDVRCRATDDDCEDDYDD